MLTVLGLLALLEVLGQDTQHVFELGGLLLADGVARLSDTTQVSLEAVVQILPNY